MLLIWTAEESGIPHKPGSCGLKWGGGLFAQGSKYRQPPLKSAPRERGLGRTIRGGGRKGGL
eukprot:4308579-Pyramimonas_sp.AAC.1